MARGRATTKASRSTPQGAMPSADITSTLIQWMIFAWIIIVFWLYYRQYIEYARFFIMNYGPQYFPGFFG